MFMLKIKPMKTNLLTIVFPVMLLFALITGCSKDEDDNSSLSPTIVIQDTAVSIEDKGSYYLVTIDMIKGASRYRIGQQYGRCIKKMVPSYESIVSVYLWQLATVQYLWGNTIPARIENIKPQLDADYRDELDGLVSQLSGTINWTAYQLVYGFNLIPDIFRATQCSAFGCWGESSATGENIAYRTLDWWGGLVHQQIPTIQSVTKIIYSDKTIYLIGALGHMGCITGINYNTGIMAAILDSDVGTSYHSPGRRSYNFDLRKSLENESTKEGIANYLAKTEFSYTFDHLIFLADENNCVILENNIANSGTQPQRALRYDNSYLNAGIYWNLPHMIGAVNCFMLNGQVNNYSQGPNNKINTQRWNLMLQKTVEKLHYNQNKLSAENVRQIMCSYWGNEPQSLIMEHGDLYNTDTQQMFLYIPVKRSLKVFFKPKNNSTPKDPSAYFLTIPLSQ